MNKVDKVCIINKIIAISFILSGICIVANTIANTGDGIINIIVSNFMKLGFAIILVNLGGMILTLTRR